MELDLANLNKNQVAQLLGKSLESVDNYIRERDNPIPFHSIGRKKYYVWSEVLPWWIKRNAPASARSTKDQLEQEKLIGQRLKNEREQIARDQALGKLVEAEDVKQFWSEKLTEIRQSLVSVGHLAADEITPAMKYGAKKAVIDKLIFSTLDELIANANTIVEDIRVSTSGDIDADIESE